MSDTEWMADEIKNFRGRLLACRKSLLIERQQRVVLELALVGVAKWIERNIGRDGFRAERAIDEMLCLQHNVINKVLVEDDAYGWRAK